jgi:hypothetical protein
LDASCKHDWIFNNYLWTQKELRESPAFRSLTKTAILVLLDFHGKVRKQRKGTGRSKIYLITNNGEITYAYSEAVKKGISRATFRNAIDQLVEKGFLDIAHSGGGYDGDLSKYALSNRWRLYGKEKFIELERPKDMRQSRGFRPKSKPKLIKRGKPDE